MEKMMTERKFEHEVRDAEKSFQATQSAATDVYETGIDLFRKGMERNIEIEKHLLEAASQQNADTVDVCRTMLGNFPGAQPMLNFAEQTVENFIGMRRKYLEIMSGQNNEMADSAKTQGERMTRAAHEATESTTTQRERQKTA
jgi:hypothetical protein